MLHRVFLNKAGHIETNFMGDLSRNDFRKVATQVQEYADQLSTAGKKVLVINDVTKIGNVAKEVQQLSFRTVRDLDFEKMAAFGMPKSLQEFANVVVTLAGKGQRIKFFEARPEAESWLTQEK